MSKVYHVELYQEIEGYPMHSFYSSKKALIDDFEDKLHVSYDTLLRKHLDEQPYENDVCIIRQGVIYTADRSNPNAERTAEVIARISAYKNK